MENPAALSKSMYGYAIRTATWQWDGKQPVIFALLLNISAHCRKLTRIKSSPLEYRAGALRRWLLPPILPAGLIAAINFAGGEPVLPSFGACENNLLAAFHVFGSKSSVPMLWIYSENDLTFGPEVAQKFYAAFTDGGGKARFIKAPPFGDNGHNLFGGERGIPFWTAYIDDFLKSENLQLRATLLPLPPSPPASPPLQPPPELPPDSKSYFDEYLTASNQKAFAVAANGFANYAAGFKNIEDAKKAALDLCQASGKQCRIALINNSPVR